jgi:hypothetical protein
MRIFGSNCLWRLPVETEGGLAGWLLLSSRNNDFIETHLCSQ